MRRKDKPEKERRTLRQILSTPRAKRIFGVIGWVLAGLSAIFLVTLALVVLTQPADRRFTRPEEWLAIGLLGLIPLVILIIGAVRLLRKRKRRTKDTRKD